MNDKAIEAAIDAYLSAGTMLRPTVDTQERIEAAIAAYQAASGEARDKDHYAWVIEQYRGSILFYWTGAPHSPWDDDHMRALRFSRRQDAECMLSWHCDGVGRVVEHGWMAAIAAREGE